MKNFQTVVQELLHNHERQRRYIALLTALCMLMAFTVSIILIEPAESMTGELACGMTEHIHSEECFTYTCGLENDASHVHSADCRTLTCGKTEHAHSENCYIHEDEQVAEIMQINEPEIFDDEPSISGETNNMQGDNGMDEPSMDSGSPGNNTRAVAEEWFTEALKEPPADAYNFSDDIKLKDENGSSNVTFTDATEIQVGEDGYESGYDYNYRADGNEVGLSFQMNYTIPAGKVSRNQPYIFYQLPEGVKVPQDFYGTEMIVYDGSVRAGFYSISQNGLIVIRFTEDYITNYIGESKNAAGGLQFSGEIRRANNADGDRNLHIGDTSIHVEFKDETFNIEKTAEKVTDPNNPKAKPKVKWTIQVTNFHSDNSLVGYKISDDHFPDGGTGVTVTMSPDATAPGYFEGKDYVIDSNFTGTLTFTFEEELDETLSTDGKSYFSKDNTATLKDSGDKVVDSDDASLKVSREPTVKKSGSLDYADNTIKWTVTIERPYNNDTLAGYTVEDAALKTATNIEVKGADGNTIDSSNYTNNGDGTLTFNDGFSEQKVTITYTSKYDDSNLTKEGYDQSIISNNVELKKEDGTSVGTTSASVNYVGTTLTKDGSYNPDKSEFTWTVHAKFEKDSSDTMFKNYTLTDDALADVTSEELLSGITAKFVAKNQYSNLDWRTLTAQMSADNNSIELYYNGELYARITKDGNTLTIDSVGDGKGVDDITFTYTQSRSKLESSTNANNSIIDESGKKYGVNKVSDNKGHDDVKGKAEIEERLNLTKALTNSTGENEVYGNDDTTARTLTWKIDIVNDTGFTGTDKVLVDELKTGETPTGAKHYITLPVNIKVQAKSESSRNFEDLDPNCYEIIYYGEDNNIVTESGKEAVKFEIKFKEPISEQNIHYVEVTYSSTADISGMQVENETVTETFSNKASFGNKENTGEYNFTRKPDSLHETVKLEVTKKWEGDSGTVTHEPIQFKLQRSTDGNSWQDIIKEEGKWVEGTGTFTLGEDGNWSIDFDDLPFDNDEHTHIYQYRVVEVTKTTGYTTDNGGAFVPNSGNDSGTITITNTKEPSYTKSVVGAVDGKIDVKTLDRIKIGDTEYYVIPYKVTFENYGKNDPLILTDTLPTNSLLCYDKDAYPDGNLYTNLGNITVQKGYYPRQDFNGSVFGLRFGENQQFTYSGNTVTFKSLDLTGILYYEILYSVSLLSTELNKNADGYPISNTIAGDGKSSTADVTITGTGETENPGTGESGVLKKDLNGAIYRKDDGNYQADNSSIPYVLYVNPQGRQLSNGGTIDILDEFSFTGGATLKIPIGKEGTTTTYKDVTLTAQEVMEMLDAGILEINVEEISDYTENDGVVSANVVRSLGSNEWSYTVEEKPGTSTSENVSYTVDHDNNNLSVWKLNGWQGGDKVKIILTGEPNHEFTGSDNNVCRIEHNGTIIFDLSGCKFDETGKLEIEFTLPKNLESNYSLQVNDWLKYTTGITATAVRTHKTLSATTALTITVPDEMPLKITYKFNITYQGDTLGTGSVFTANNSVTLNTGSSYATDSEDGNSFYVVESTAWVGVDRQPSIVKYNVGNAGDKKEATFYLAKYENSQWNFVTGATPTYPTDSDKDITHTMQYDNAKSSNNSIPSGAYKIELPVEYNGKQYYNYNLDLNTKTLYKIIEVVAPEGYQAADSQVSAIVPSGAGHYEHLEDLLKDYLNNGLSTKVTDADIRAKYESLLNAFVSVHYFKYGSEDVQNMPTGFSESVQTVDVGGTLGIPNNELIDITAEKTWQKKDEDTLNSVEFTLYWSYTKSTSGFPENVEKVEAGKLGIITAFENPKKVDYSGEGSKTSYTWHDLPNGLNDRPIYYYVRETAYTINNIRYEYDKTSGTYKNGSDEGDYKPTYTGNALNKDGTVTVTNASGLVIQKTWLKSNKDKMTETEIPADKIKCNIYGKVSSNSSKVLIEEEVILEKPDWKYTPTDLSKYTSYDYIIIEETAVHLKNSENPDEWQPVDTALYGYVRSSTSNVTDGIGTATLINKDTSATEIDVTINKIWADGNEKHNGDSVTVNLYQTTETTMTDPTGDPYRTATLNEGNNWTETFENLPAKDESNIAYHYFAFEDPKPENYEVKYEYSSVNGKQIIDIINYKKESISVEKKWVDQSGKPVEPSNSDSIKVNVYRREILPSGKPSSENANLNIVAIGDSITKGIYNELPPDVQYPYQLEQLLKANGYTGVTVKNTGENGYEVGGTHTVDCEHGKITKLLDSIDLNNANAVCLLIGTNDVHHHTDWDVANIAANIEDLIGQIKNKKEGLVVFVGSIPYFDFVDENGKTTTGGSWWGYDYTQESADQRINSLNDEISKLGNGNDIIYVDVCSAVNKDTMLEDGCHPNAAGYEAIARAFARAIHKKYADADLLADETVELDINKVPADLLTAIESGKLANVNSKSGNYELVEKEITLNSENSWQQTISGLPTHCEETTKHEYVYYFVEVDEEGKPIETNVKYEHNGQKSESRTGIIITNTKEVPKADLQVEKIWHDGGDAASRPNITFTLERKTSESDWVAVENPQFKWTSQDGNTWLGTFSDLDVYTDINAKTEYSYRVKEVFPDSSEKYIVEYSDNQEGVQIKESPAENKLTVTNTKAIDLNLQKVWKNGGNNSVTFKVHRGTTNVNTSQTLAFAEKEGYSSSKPAYISTNGDGTTLTFNQTINDWKISPDDSNIEVTKGSDGKTLVIKAGADTGEYTLTVTHGKETLEIKIVVSAFTIEASAENAIIGGDGITLTAKEGGSPVTEGVTYTLENDLQGEFVTIDGDKVTAKKYTAEPITIVGTYGDKQAEVTIHVAYSGELTFTDDEEEVEVGDSITLTLSSADGIIDCSAEPEDAVTLERNGNNLVVRGQKATEEVTITVKRDDNTTATKTIKVKESEKISVFLNDKDVTGQNLTLYAGMEYTFKTSKEIKTISKGDWTYDLTQIDSTNFKLSAKNEDIYNTYSVTVNDQKLFDFKILAYEELKFISPSPEQIELTDSSEYTIKTNKPATFSVSGDSIEIIGDKENVDTIKVKAKQLGDATIYAECAGKSGTEKVEMSITVVNEITKLSPAKLLSVKSNEVLELPHSDLIKAIEFECSANTSASYTLKDRDNIDICNSSFNLEVNKPLIVRIADLNLQGKILKYLCPLFYNGTLTVTLYYDENDIPEETEDILSRQGVRLMSVSDFDVVATVTLKETDTVNGVKWAKILENLPAYDESGNAYYYWVEEVDAAGYDVTYQYFDGDEKTEFDDTAINAEKAGDATVVVTNTKTESSTTTMPSTGGNGARKYYTVGGMLLLMSACGWAMHRRKRVIPH